MSFLAASSFRPSTPTATRVVCFSAEMARIVHHLEGALELLVNAPPPTDPVRARRRSECIEELERYVEDGIFPLNVDRPDERVPTFVDPFGVRCAMAHLLDAFGEPDLVLEVAREANHAYVRDLALDPRFLAWLDAHGLRVEEAARIQPSYCYSVAERCFCFAVGSPHETVAEGRIVDSRSVVVGPGSFSRTVADVRIEAVHGVAGSLSQGDVVQVYTGGTIGSDLLLGLLPASDAGVGAAVAYPLRSDGTVETGATGGSGASCPTLSKQDAIAAMLAPSCESSLIATSPDWDHRPSCEPVVGCGRCAASHSGPHEVFAPVWLSLATFVIVRLRRRRSDRRE